MSTIIGKTFDEERALYGACDLVVKDCKFDGPADGESACKEGKILYLRIVCLTQKTHFGMPKM